MKKLIKAFLTAAVCLSCMAGVVHAQVGDKVGEALNTDIVAYVNHYAIPSFAVNGQSVVVAEDLRNFGFDVTWDDASRSLNIARSQSTEPQTMNVDKSAIPGTFFADILETDIRVFANGQQITSYAMNGYTMVPMEELGMFGEVAWVDFERAIKLWIDGFPVSPEKQAVTITPVSLTNLDLQEIKVLPAEVRAYEAAGWYQYNDFINAWAMKLAGEQGYEAAVNYLEGKLYSAEFNYGSSATPAQLATLDSLYQNWYAQTGVPLVIRNTSISYNSINVPQVNINLLNISGKYVTSFELEWVCYDAYGNITTDYPWLYNGSFTGWMDNADLSARQTKSYYWTLYSNERTTSIRNLRVTRVAFSDGTSWVG